MIAAAIGLLCTVLPFVFKLIERKWARDTPQKRHDDARAEIDRAIADGDAGSVNRLLDSDIDRLQSSRASAERKPGSQPG